MAAEERRLAAIVSTDVVGYSRLMGADESGTLAALRTHRAALIDPKIDSHGGRIVKTMGDGLLLEFPSVVEATQCGVEVQQGMAARNTDVPAAQQLVLRIGVNLGDIIIDGEDIHGDGVNIAARLQERAEPGGICISSRVYDDVRDRLEVEFTDSGLAELKNIKRPVHVWRWSAQPDAVGQSYTTAEPAPALPDKPSIVVLPFDSMNFNNYVALASAHNVKEQYEQAIDLYKRALEERPHADWIYRNLAACLCGGGSMEEARGAFARLLEIYPDLVATKVKQAMVFSPNF